MNILIVDDSKTVIMQEKMLLGAMGYKVFTAENGNQAIQIAKEKKIDLIFMDINMPELNGIWACRFLKASNVTRHIPIIMLTTENNAEKIQKAFEAGCDDYLTKPIDKLKLLSKVNVFAIR